MHLNYTTICLLKFDRFWWDLACYHSFRDELSVTAWELYWCKIMRVRGSLMVLHLALSLCTKLHQKVSKVCARRLPKLRSFPENGCMLPCAFKHIYSHICCHCLVSHTFSLDSGTRQETLLCRSRNSWNCWSLMTNLSASLRADSPAFSPSIRRHWNTCTQQWWVWGWVYYMCHGTSMHWHALCFLCGYLPADWVELDDLLRHVFVDVEGVDDRVDFEGHFILLAPAADLVQIIEVALPALSSADQLVGCFVKTVARDGQDVQIVTWDRQRESLILNVLHNICTGAKWRRTIFSSSSSPSWYLFGSLPYFWNHFSLIMLPLLTMLTLGSWRSTLQYSTNFPRNSPLSCKKGSPPEKLIFSIPNKQMDKINQGQARVLTP